MTKATTNGSGQNRRKEELMLETLTSGTIFAGKYRIVSVLGKGGVGIVYKAEHIHINRMVAIKTLHSSFDIGSSGAKRFQQEAQTAAAVAHPNIVHVDDFGIADGRAFLVLELLDGKTLDEVHLESGPMPIARFLSIFSQATEAMEHAHKTGFIHRDVKCSNLMLIDTPAKVDFLKIVDFGLAKPQQEAKDQSLTQSGTVIGSPLYMSPEQCRGFKADARSDIYAIGCVMYRALTGNYPVMGQNVLDTMSKHLQDRPKELTLSNPDVYIPYRLQQLVMRMLEKEPGDRPQTMQDVGETLKRMQPQMATAIASSIMSYSKPAVTAEPKPKSVAAKPTENPAPQRSSFHLTSGHLEILRFTYVPLFLLSLFVPFAIWSQFPHQANKKGGPARTLHLSFVNAKENQPQQSATAAAQPTRTVSGSDASPATNPDGTVDSTSTGDSGLPAGTDPAQSGDTSDPVKTRTNESDAAYSLAQEARQLNDMPKTISLLKQSAALLDPAQTARHGAISLEIGDCYTQLGNPDEARPYYEEAVKIAPPDSDVARAATSKLGTN